MSVIKLSLKDWASINSRIREEYKDMPSVYLIRNKMKCELGFTVRNHRELVTSPEDPNHYSFRYYQHEIHLDFYDEGMEIFFRLKYL